MTNTNYNTKVYIEGNKLKYSDLNFKLNFTFATETFDIFN